MGWFTSKGPLPTPGQQPSQDTLVKVAPFTTYLATLHKGLAPTLEGSTYRTTEPYSLGNNLQLAGSKLDRNILGTYEATLTFMSYLSRLIYENKPRNILKAFALLNFCPITFNTGLSAITGMSSARYQDANLYRIEKTPKDKIPSGYLLYGQQHDIPVSLTVFDYTKPENPSIIFKNKKILVISFRGTLSISTAITDLNIALKNLFELYGVDQFREEYEEVERRRKESVTGFITNPFGAHRGFVEGLKDIYTDIVARLELLLKFHPDVSNIFITGQSLGGAYCSLMGLGLAQIRKNKLKAGGTMPPIHVISFGAPKVFTDYARNVFNGLLLEGHLTLDRVTNRPKNLDPSLVFTDVVPLIPGHLDHPGFMILKTEGLIKSTLRTTGRTKHIRNVRSELTGNSESSGSWTSTLARSLPSALKLRNYNPLPYYQEFLTKFLDGQSGAISPKEYKFLITTLPMGTVRFTLSRLTEYKILYQKILDITGKAIGITSQEVQQGAEQTAIAAEEVAKQASAEGAPAALITAGQAGEAEEGGEGEQKGGGETNTQKYKSLTVQMQPNHVVYSCSMITVPLVLAGVTCHLGYMGVGYLGVWHNAGSKGIVQKSRDYDKIATLYCTNNGRWTYVPDTDEMYYNTDVKHIQTAGTIASPGQPLTTIVIYPEGARAKKGPRSNAGTAKGPRPNAVANPVNASASASAPPLAKETSPNTGNRTGGNTGNGTGGNTGNRTGGNTGNGTGENPSNPVIGNNKAKGVSAGKVSADPVPVGLGLGGKRKTKRKAARKSRSRTKRAEK